MLQICLVKCLFVQLQQTHMTMGVCEEQGCESKALVGDLCKAEDGKRKQKKARVQWKASKTLV